MKFWTNNVLVQTKKGFLLTYYLSVRVETKKHVNMKTKIAVTALK